MMMLAEVIIAAAAGWKRRELLFVGRPLLNERLFYPAQEKF